METIRSAGQFGINVSGFSVDFEKIVNRTNGIVDLDSDGIRQAFSQIENPKLFSNECRFVGKKMISVGGQKIKADKILIASGTRPAIPRIEGLEGSGFITSDEALWYGELPSSAVIIGAGAWIVGSVLMGLYLLVSLNVFGRHSQQAFSALRIEDFKHFLRLHIGADGALTIYPIRIDRVPRRWRERASTGASPSGLVPETPLEPALSLFDAVDDLLPLLDDVRCPVLVMTSVVDHVAPPAGSDDSASPWNQGWKNQSSSSGATMLTALQNT